MLKAFWFLHAAGSEMCRERDKLSAILLERNQGMIVWEILGLSRWQKTIKLRD